MQEFSNIESGTPSEGGGGASEQVSEAAKDMAGQMERGFFQMMDDAVKKSGNTIPGNPPLGPESVLLALGMTSIDFEDDDRSKPVKPTIFAAPEAFEKFKELEAKTTPEELAEYQKKEAAILDKKYEEYMQDISSRKIID